MGLTNYAQLKGLINGIEKEIHVFIDKHFDLNEQTKCESFNSIDISYYLYNLIKESNEPFDFFMEIGNGNGEFDNNNISNKREIYIKEVVKLFKSEFAFEKNNDENIKYSKTNSNVKLHYFDIRDHLNIFFLTKIINQKIIKYVNLLNMSNNENEKNKYVDKILFYLNLIDNQIEKLDKNTEEIIKNKINTYDKTNFKQEYYLNKIINMYLDESVKKNINLFLYIHCKEIINNIKSVITKMKNIVENLFLMNMNKFEENLDKLGENILQLYSMYTDAYLMRRILDKNYVNKCIIYSGGSHSVNVIFFLVKYFNFKIIKIQYSTESDINVLMDNIKNEMFSFDIYELFLLKKANIQCIQWESLGLDDTISAEFIKYKKKNYKKTNKK